MRPAEQGFLLLSSHLGDSRRRVLTTAQLRTLAQRARLLSREDRDMTVQDLMDSGYDRVMAERILGLLSDEAQLQRYLSRGAQMDCYPLSRISAAYPAALRDRMGLDAPGCLWAKGDVQLLTRPAVALVGSRDLRPENAAFAAEVGRQAALQGYVLVSGNARGADQAAQQACLDADGCVISVVADVLSRKPLTRRILWLAEDGFDLDFSSQRALRRNRVIHALGALTLVAQCSYETGGTWDGTVQNLRRGYSSVCCFADGSAAVKALLTMGAADIRMGQLQNLSALQQTMKG